MEDDNLQEYFTQELELYDEDDSLFYDDSSDGIEVESYDP